VVVVGPGVYIGGQQADLLDAARAEGVATVTAVASWDNLTTKGLLRGGADRVLVWNDALAEEAARLHQVPRERVRVTGAANFDKWFGREPSRSAEEHAELVGLPPGRPYALFVGSTARILAPRDELDFVREWIEALRASDDPRLRDLAVVARPHPHNRLRWEQQDLDGLAAASVWPRGAANPVDPNDRAEYFDSIYHACAVVGINTSAMVEAAIIGRPVFTITPPKFTGTQMATLHFKHLLPENGGFVRRASSLDEHLAQLAAVLGDEAAARDELRAFVGRFIRPHGLDRDATSFFADEVEAAAAAGPVPQPPPGRGARLAMRILAGLGVGWLDRNLGADDLPKRLRNRALTGTVLAGPLELVAGRVGRWRLAYDDESGDLDV
jgi:hypothetical protein